MDDAATIGPLGWIGQALLYGLFALVVGVFSRWPAYQHLPPDQALIKVSFNHQGKPVSECQRVSAEELAKLPPNMRAPMECPRERSPVSVELALDGKTLAHRSAPPSGLSRDGASTLYERFAVPAGEHELSVKFNDSVRVSGFNYAREEEIDLRPGQVLVVDFNPHTGGILIQ